MRLVVTLALVYLRINIFIFSTRACQDIARLRIKLERMLQPPPNENQVCVLLFSSDNY